MMTFKGPSYLKSDEGSSFCFDFSFIYFFYLFFIFYLVFLLFCLNCYNWCLYFRLSPLSVLISGIVLVRPSVVQPSSQSHVLFHENGRYTRDVVDIFSTLSSRKFKLYKLNGQPVSHIITWEMKRTSELQTFDAQPPTSKLAGNSRQ